MTTSVPQAVEQTSAIAARCQSIALLVLDVDGVLTDGVIAVDDQGIETKHFHVRDGAGVSIWKKAGKRVAILSGRSARAVDHRARDLGIDPVIQGAAEKEKPFLSMLASLELEAKQVCYVGDDLPDLPVLRLAGFSACPADAAPEVRAAVHYVAQAPGGRGAVREVIELLLESQGLWKSILESYRNTS